METVQLREREKQESELTGRAGEEENELYLPASVQRNPMKTLINSYIVNERQAAAAGIMQEERKTQLEISA